MYTGRKEDKFSVNNFLHFVLNPAILIPSFGLGTAADLANCFNRAASQSPSPVR
jgi:hypothetical protein